MEYSLTIQKRTTGARHYGWEISRGTMVISRSRMTYSEAGEAEAAGKKELNHLEAENK